MRSVSTIYSEYHIMPTLQLHQLRVAAVAKIICDALQEPIDSKSVITAELFHDMGNIIKFDLSYFPEFVEPEGLEYWQKVKDSYIAKYGPNEHIATELICKEIGLEDKVIENLGSIGFSKAEKVVADPSFAKKICCYADQRVGPHGILSLNERLTDGQKRYQGRKDKAISMERFAMLSNSLFEIEKQIFTKANISPEVITNELVNSIIPELRAAEV